MRHSIQLILGCITLAALLITLINPAPVQNKPGASRRSPQAWTLEEALAQLRLYPHDAYKSIAKRARTTRASGSDDNWRWRRVRSRGPSKIGRASCRERGERAE